MGNNYPKPGRRFDEQNARAMALMHQLLENADIDNRLTDGQKHAAAVEALGCDPFVWVCNLLSLATNAKSKISLHPNDALKIGLAIVDRVYGPPDVKMRRKDSPDQFTLEFAWATPDGPARLTAEGEIVK